MDLQETLYSALYIFELVIIFYLAAINIIYFVLMVLGYFSVRSYQAGLTSEQQKALFRSPLVPAISVLAPAYNEAATIRESVRGMLNLLYPNHEVIIINDGSRDDTLKILIEEFKLFKSGRMVSDALATKPIRAVYESQDPVRLVVLDKENGGKADSLNAGLNATRSPLFAAVDSDSLLEPEALLYVVKPFLEDFEGTLGTGGIVRVVNGCQVEHGRVTRVAAPGSMLAKFQAVEYLRAFLGGRTALSFINALLVISGAFGVFRRDAVIASGGFLTTTVGEDMELVVRIHRSARESKRPYRIVFVPNPVCWTEVPESLKILYRQRNRWQRGTVECISLHKKMLLNPKYGVVGLFAIPYFALFEMFGPAVELTGYVFTILGLAVGIISWEIALLFFMVSMLFGIWLSISAIVLEEFTARRYPSPRDVMKLFWAGILENLGFRQLLTIWRTQGLIDGFRGKKGWGAMQRRGFQSR